MSGFFFRVSNRMARGEEGFALFLEAMIESELMYFVEREIGL